MNKSSPIYIVGHIRIKGFVGSAILRRQKKEGYHDLVYQTTRNYISNVNPQ